MDDALRAAAETAVEECLGLTADETVAVVTDDERLPVGEAVYAAATARSDDVTLLRYPPGSEHGEEPPAPVAAAMREADAFLAPTTYSITHTRARQRATEAGARGATMPGITADVMIAGLDADYEAIAAGCRSIHDQVRDAETVRVTAPGGTDVTVRPGDRPWHRDTGLVREPGSFSNLPAGETFVSPTTADGTIVVDGTMRPHGLVEEPVRIEVADGQVVSVDDDGVRGSLEAAAAAADDPDAVYNLAELGIGANVGVADLAGSVLLDEKAAGTVHLAVGDDASIGGDVEAPIHTDGVVRSPTVYADGEAITLPSP
ncbi:MAG: leucyl aminopeptidase (aminopeptidase T) [uncultured archaeon A07HB70]|jgi:Leucyl aminopeptidase (aminopeptidase T)|nr:MAG: leucyl aminopeptidase (aminopeptidase T) [uncultured archaeon A07HB70]